MCQCRQNFGPHSVQVYLSLQFYLQEDKIEFNFFHDQALTKPKDSRMSRICADVYRVK